MIGGYKSKNKILKKQFVCLSAEGIDAERIRVY